MLAKEVQAYQVRFYHPGNDPAEIYEFYFIDMWVHTNCLQNKN